MSDINSRKFITRRYILFFISVFINAYGISFITKAMLGTSPITSVNYVLSMFTALTMGQWTIIVNLLFLVLELFFMTRSQFKSDLRVFLLQIPITLCFGTFIDISMSSLSWLNPSGYAAQAFSVIAGCVILALGIALEVKADVAMVAGEFFVRTIARRIHGDFGYVKLGFDIANVLIACALSLIFLSAVRGVGLGTVAAAFLVGPIVHVLTPWCRVLDGVLGYNLPAAAGQAAAQPSAHTIYTIAREYGSGGRLLAEKLAKRLGVKVYDREFIKLAAKNSGMTEEYIMKNEQTIPSFWLKCMLTQGYGTQAGRGLSADDVLFIAESKTIKEIADREPCVILGRCADFVLGGGSNVVRVFCYTDEASAVDRCVNQYGLDKDKALSEIRRVNHARANHYEYYTGRRWGDPHNYDLTVNTGRMSLDTACEIIARIKD